MTLPVLDVQKSVTYGRPILLKISPVTQWAAVRTYLGEIRLPPHEKDLNPVEFWYWINTIQGNSSISASSPPRTLSVSWKLSKWNTSINVNNCVWFMIMDTQPTTVNSNRKISLETLLIIALHKSIKQGSFTKNICCFIVKAAQPHTF